MNLILKNYGDKLVAFGMSSIITGFEKCMTSSWKSLKYGWNPSKHFNYITGLCVGNSEFRGIGDLLKSRWDTLKSARQTAKKGSLEVEALYQDNSVLTNGMAFVLGIATLTKFVLSPVTFCLGSIFDVAVTVGFIIGGTVGKVILGTLGSILCFLAGIIFLVVGLPVYGLLKLIGI